MIEVLPIWSSSELVIWLMLALKINNQVNVIKQKFKCKQPNSLKHSIMTTWPTSHNYNSKNQKGANTEKQDDNLLFSSVM